VSRRWFWILVAAAFLVGLGIRLAATLARPDLHAAGDPAEYWLISNSVASGQGWIEPILFKAYGLHVQTAKLPPLYTLLLSLCSLGGFKSFLAHRVWSAVLSAIGVPVAAAMGREIAGRAVGVVTACGVALYPNLWMSSSIGMSETISPVLAMLVVWAGYRLWRDPTPGQAVVLGATIGLAALARDEMLVFAGLILAPAAFGRRGGSRPWSVRLKLLGAGVATAVLVIGPWVGYNLSRFPRPVFITDRLGLTLASANCPIAWSGPYAGYWSQTCALQSVGGVTDETAQQSPATHFALTYIGDHLASLPKVEVVRLGRTFAFSEVSNQMELDIHVENRPALWVWVGLWSFYALVLLTPFGLIRLRRAGVVTFPLWAVLADVVVVVLLTYGETRFRATLEPVLVLLGAVAVCGFLGAPVRPDERDTTESTGGTGPPEGASSREPSGPMSAAHSGGAPPATSGS
jgi:hypothetical protein